MQFDLLHPADQLALIMERIYQSGLTTTSGGNLSILDENGDIWITPGGVDKGTLTRNDMCCVKPDGTVVGPHKPSVELPFHASIYRKRPELKAVLHAHSPALVAFSAVRVLPQISLTSNMKRTLDTIAIAEYAVPGSKTLGDNISHKFEQGFDVVVLENHGVVIGSDNLFEAFKKFETLESCARIEIYARKLGTPKTLQDDEIELSMTQNHLDMEEFVPNNHSSEECALRRDMVKFIRRSYRQCLFGSTQGNYSARLSDGSFLITPYGIDRAYMNESDLVLIKDGKKEQGKTPSRSIHLHQIIYERHPEIHSILGAMPPHAMAFTVTDEVFDPRTIPESYLLLREIQKVSYSALYLEPEAVSDRLCSKTPVLICQNSQILATGKSLLDAFDRLEVAEATAHSILYARDIAEIVHISDSEVKDIDKAFNLN